MTETVNEHPHRYTAALANVIEPAWQERWESAQAYRAPNPGEAEFDASRPKYYCLDMFPYPSGAGLHVGHPEGYTASDIICRHRRMRGFNVLHPMGWDAFGLPAEQYAVQTNVHPAITTRSAIETFRRQLRRFGFSYDWSRELATIDPEYYRWTQWIWLQAYHAWYDPAANAARPIAELVRELENGVAYVGPGGELLRPGAPQQIEAVTGEPIGAIKWQELDDAERRDFLDRHRLAYLGEQVVNWCPKLGTVLANEEVVDGRSERGGHPVLRQPLRQWMFRITAYAERLLRDLDLIRWPESTRAMQIEWIGRSEGAEIDFELPHRPDRPFLRVYTTRPDTLFGATYMVVAPEHPLVEEILADPPAETDVAALRTYVESARQRADLDRMTDAKEKSGVFTGVHAINPATERPIPVWTAEYVLMGYGHGSIMAVPAHDQRDFEFARRFGLPLRQVIAPHPGTPEAQRFPAGDPGAWPEAFAGDGTVVASANAGISLDGLGVEAAKREIVGWLDREGVGSAKVNYRLRDWLFSRQRYWGEPFPIVYDAEGNHYPVQAAALPVRLPQLDDFRPVESDQPSPPLERATAWVHTTAGEAGVDPTLLPPETPVRRETNTMPNWAGSCWYYLRFCDPRNATRFVGVEAERYWMLSPRDDGSSHAGGVDLYIGGAEHAVLHLLYARFWHKMLFDLGWVSTPEPMGRLFHQGLILSFAYERPDGTLVAVDEVDESAGADGAPRFTERGAGTPLTQVVAKMSKSLRNVINPDDVIAEFGADTFRLYEMAMGPLEASKPWNPRDIAGQHRFLQRLWRLAIDERTGAALIADEPDARLERLLHRTIHRVGGDIERLSFNTAIAAMIEFVNAATASAGQDGRVLTLSQLERIVLCACPFVPHVAEELWQRLGHGDLAVLAAWPTVDPALLVDDEVELPVALNGKVRHRIVVPATADPAAIESLILADSKVIELLAGKPPRKVVVVPGKMVNLVP
ncbi:MAG TPA: leucine--tRNA ligase [Phycisphaerales bacterium]|nr:leucine--tRNA ligase [Phycisphaerales bacterium]HMP36138.1 leucine--tRNA ligase [Phycisphaerales bacterium]